MREIISDFFSSLLLSIGFTDIIDIIIVAFVIYKVLEFIKETRAEQLVKGLFVLGLMTFLSSVLNLYTLNWILLGTLQIGVIALVILFQPELRRALEYIGRSKIMPSNFMDLDKERAKHLINEFARAVENFSANRIGALIIIERETALNDIIETGTTVDAEVSSELLGNVFYEGAPLHDGAVIVRGDRLVAAGCVLPLTQNKNINKELGTRHRAGIGITEISDAIAIVVSEETGIISMAIDGKLSRFLDVKTVEKTLFSTYLESDVDRRFSKIKPLWGRKKDAPK
ncbi:MAG: diadenylate cyclase CdaA [Eubacteriales bacterium]|nr:diadenylate cyclase CdaA [Eubacteriales bacterium]MDD4389586.1 diadenylate cyclase CdaA [Eubacteriales bacterium]